MQSRYYDPVTHRFINADSLASTGQGILGTNMFAYCLNRPVNCIDSCGATPIDVAVEFLDTWLWGDGSDVIYEDDTEVAKVFAASPTTKRCIDEALELYLDGKDYETGSITYNSDETDLWLAARRANYKITIEEKEKYYFTPNNKAIKVTYYKITMVIYDLYNFNTGDETGDGIGSFLNNMAYKAHQYGLGNDYRWEVQITKISNWHVEIYEMYELIPQMP